MASYDALTDPVTLFILKTLVDADGMSIAGLDDVIANGRGWARVIRLVQARIVDLAGDYIEVTDFGRQAYGEIAQINQA